MKLGLISAKIDNVTVDTEPEQINGFYDDLAKIETSISAPLKRKIFMKLKLKGLNAIPGRLISTNVYSYAFRVSYKRKAQRDY